MIWGFTARMTTSDSATSAGLLLAERMPYCVAIWSNRSRRTSVAPMDAAGTSPACSSPLIMASPMLPAPRKPTFLPLMLTVSPSGRAGGRRWPCRPAPASLLLRWRPRSRRSCPWTGARGPRRHGARAPVHGHERRLRGRHRRRSDAGAGWHGHLRPPARPEGDTVSIKGKKVGFLGAGNMGEAMIKGLLQAGLVPAASIGATDVRRERLEQIATQYGIRSAKSNPALVAESDVVILAVKPQIMASVLHEIAGSVDGKLLISIAAGLPTRMLRAQLGRPARLIRVMPNTPALVLEGVTAIARADGLEAGDLETAQELFGAVGRVVVLEEDALDAVTGLSGSGPAYVAIVIESLADGGVKMGLDRATAMTLAAQTVLGSAKLILETGTHPGQLKDMVASPGGTTIAGISALEEGGVRRTFISAVERATQRSRELGKSG